jgi:hypothetical protein
MSLNASVSATTSASGAVGLDPATGRQRVDPPHQPREALERRQDAAQDHEEHAERDRESHEQDEDLPRGGRHRDRDRGQDENADGERADGRVRGEEPPEQAPRTHEAIVSHVEMAISTHCAAHGDPYGQARVEQ